MNRIIFRNLVACAFYLVTFCYLLTLLAIWDFKECNRILLIEDATGTRISLIAVLFVSYVVSAISYGINNLSGYTMNFWTFKKELIINN